MRRHPDSSISDTVGAQPSTVREVCQSHLSGVNQSTVGVLRGFYGLPGISAFYHHIAASPLGDGEIAF